MGRPGAKFPRASRAGSQRSGQLPLEAPASDLKSGPAAADDGDAVHQVGQLNRIVRRLLESRFERVWVEGELSDVTKHASGHVYFTLNDPVEVAQLRGVMFRSDARRTQAELRPGASVRFRGSLSLYPERGSYQLIARVAVPAGAGDLLARFERLKKKLAKEGLTSLERKRPLPAFPRVVGVVTSAHGAALQDIIRVAKGRFPVRLLVSDCRVQGVEAPASIVRALNRLASVEQLDAVLVARGGGSGEDLWAFNDEAVVRAIASCRAPVVTGLGHEIDQTLADLVADASAATPSNAVEQLLPERAAVEEQLFGLTHRLERAATARLDRERLALAQLARRVTDPRTRLRDFRARLGKQLRRLRELGKQHVAANGARLAQWSRRHQATNPRIKIREDRRRLFQLRQSLTRHGPAATQGYRRVLLTRISQLKVLAGAVTGESRLRLSTLQVRLKALDPNAVLERGYAIALHEGRALLRASDVSKGDKIELRLARGQVEASVTETDEGDP